MVFTDPLYLKLLDDRIPVDLAAVLFTDHDQWRATCWPWMGHIRVTSVRSRPRAILRNQPAEKALYELLRGSCGTLKNTCGNFVCVNPYHWESVHRKPRRKPDLNQFVETPHEQIIRELRDLIADQPTRDPMELAEILIDFTQDEINEALKDG